MWRGAAFRVILVAFAGAACAHGGDAPDASASADQQTPARSAESGDPDTGAEPAVQTPSETQERPREPGTIFRDELVRATAGGKPGYLMRQLDPEPYRPSGRFQGWRINRVFPDDPTLCAGKCDLRPKDVILTVNGSPLERPEQLSALVETIGEMTELRVRLVRDGKLYERTYAIVD